MKLKEAEKIPSHIQSYLDSRGTRGPWAIEGKVGSGYQGAVVIPSLAEYDLLFRTLDCLGQNPGDILARILVVVVVNHRRDAPDEDKVNNNKTLFKLKKLCNTLNNIPIGFVNASCPGRELPPKTGGVGLARKIGFDLTLPRLDYATSSPFLISLDADTLCRPDYLPAITHHFQSTNSSGAVIPFCHQRGETPAQDAAISRYELFLRTYVLGLDLAASPFAFHTVGSAMACTADSYVRIGGMKARAAAEDFYFLDHLAKYGGVAQVQGTIVYPSARTSNRVPFGTGRSMSRLLSNDNEAVLFYQPGCFRILGEWLKVVRKNLEEEGEVIQAMAQDISSSLAEFLGQIDFSPVWERLRRNFRSPASLLTGFFTWFDGLKTMKLIHHLSDGPFPRREPETVMPEFLRWAGLEPVSGLEKQLDVLRRLQIGSESFLPQNRPD